MKINTRIARNARGQVVDTTAPKEDGPFTCLTCEEVLSSKKGDHNVHHYSHIGSGGGSSGHAGGSETVEHFNCKTWIAANIQTLQVVRRCRCGQQRVVFRGTPGMCGSTEKRVDGTESTYIADVMVKSGDAQVAVVEVWHTHECGPQKLRDLDAQLGSNVFEVVATTSHDMQLLCTRHWTCDTCVREQERKANLAEQLRVREQERKIHLQRLRERERDDEIREQERKIHHQRLCEREREAKKRRREEEDHLRKQRGRDTAKRLRASISDMDVQSNPKVLTVYDFVMDNYLLPANFKSIEFGAHSGVSHEQRVVSAYIWGQLRLKNGEASPAPVPPDMRMCTECLRMGHFRRDCMYMFK